MRVLYVGQCFAYPAAGHCGSHGVTARDLGLAWALARAGHTVEIAALNDGPTAEGLRRVHVESVRPLGYDACVISGVEGWWTAKRNAALASVREHPRLAVYLDTAYHEALDELPTGAVVGLASERARALAAARRPGRYLVTPWGMTRSPDVLADPYPRRTGVRVLYAGIVYPRWEAVLAALATRSGLELWVAGLFRGADGRWGALPRVEAERRLPGARWVSDLLGCTHGEVGPVAYGDALLGAMRHADVCVCLALEAGCAAPSCKLHDYLGSGCRVVTEEGPPNAVDVLACEAGSVVPLGDVEALYAATLLEGATPRAPLVIRDRAQQCGTWGDAARALLAEVCR